MSRRIAITRAAPDNERTAQNIRARGGEAALAPLLHIIPRDHDTRTEGAQALIFTSAAGVRAFAGARALAVLCVGDATAAAARAAGFADVRAADGDVRALADLARAALSPAGGRLIHVSGDHVAGDLAGALAHFTLERRVAYAARAASALPAPLQEPFDAVLFHSARAAQTYRALDGPARGRMAGCLSPAVAEAAGAGWARLIVAPAPREDALLDAVFAAFDSSAGASA